MKKGSSENGATLTKIKSSGAGPMFMKRRTPKPELCHLYDGSAALFFSTAEYCAPAWCSSTHTHSLTLPSTTPCEL